MQTVADMRGVGVKNRGKFADVLCERPPSGGPWWWTLVVELRTLENKTTYRKNWQFFK